MDLRTLQSLFNTWHGSLGFIDTNKKSAMQISIANRTVGNVDRGWTHIAF